MTEHNDYLLEEADVRVGLARLNKAGVDELPVQARDGRFVGVVTRQGIMAALTPPGAGEKRPPVN